MQKLLFDRYIISDNATIYDKEKNRYISFTIRNDKFLTLKLNVSGDRKTFSLHKLMAESFFDNFNESLYTISFKDNNSKNCVLENLKIESLYPDVILTQGKRKKIYDHYEVDSNGYVINTHTGLILKGHVDKDGYVSVYLKHNGKGFRRMIHKMVLNAFEPDYNEENDVIYFKDNNKQNCSLENLHFEKDAKIYELPNQEMNEFFESQNPYAIVDFYMRFIFSRDRFHAITNAFTKDDLRQYLIYYLWKKVPYYLKKVKDIISLKTFAFRIFDNLFKNKHFWQHVTSFYGVVKLDVDNFDYETYSYFSTLSDAIQNGYGAYFESFKSN